MKMETSVVMRYCQVLDEFIKIRLFTEEESADLLRSFQAPSKRDFVQLIVNACVVHYHERVLPLIRQKVATTHAEELLYPFCIEVNPQFDIHKVSIPVVEHEIDKSLHLVDDARRQPARTGRERYLHLAERISARVVGQEEAVGKVARCLQRAAVGIRNLQRPIGAFLFIGQTGVGKTELAKALAETLYGDANRLIRIDCSEYSLPHEYAKLIGAPPGYIGHDEGGQLTEMVKKRKEGVVLFDEIEKADYKVHNLLLQLLDEGFITDSKGARVPFGDCVIILTSNLGVRQIEEFANRAGFGSRGSVEHDDRAKITQQAVKDFFRPEFINRLDDVVVFRSLEPDDARRIADLMLAEVSRRAKRAALTLSFDPKVRDLLCEEGFKAEFGARELRRTVERLLETPLSQEVLEGRLKEGSRVRVCLRKGEVAFRTLSASPSRAARLSAAQHN